MPKRTPKPKPPAGTPGAESPGDNRKYKVRRPLLDRLEKLAERKATDVTELVNQAVREMLEREGYWPPPEAGA